MNIFGIYLNKTFIKIYFKMHQIVPFKKIIGGACPRTPQASVRPNSKKLGLANPAYAHDVCIYIEVYDTVLSLF